jgi:transcriptional regulator with XRE-family HTH domain
MDELIDRIVRIRTDNNCNQAQFADRLNLNRTTISLFENGKRGLSKRTLIDISEKFNVNLEWLETGEGEPYRETTESLLKLLKAEYDLDELDIKIIEAYLELSPIERQVFKDYIKKIKGAD